MSGGNPGKAQLRSQSIERSVAGFAGPMQLATFERLGRFEGDDVTIHAVPIAVRFDERRFAFGFVSQGVIDGGHFETQGAV